MDFNIRAISIAESIPHGARASVSEFLGQQIVFRAGISISITLPDRLDQFRALPESERVLTALTGWSRVYRYPDDVHERIQILATAEGGEDEVLFYRVDLRQPRPPRRGPRPVVEILGGALMMYEQCADWLIDLAHELDESQAVKQRLIVLPRSRSPKSKLRVAVVGPEIIERVNMPRRLNAIGKVLGADIVNIPPRSFQDVRARLARILPLNTVVVLSGFSPYITAAAVPDAVRRDLIHLCGGRARLEIERQVRASIDSDREMIEADVGNQSSISDALLKIMLRGMLSHSKIGQFNHCPKATLLTGVRARRLNVVAAERILDENSEAFKDTKRSEALFLWKEHHDGRQYFLNPKNGS